MGFIKTKVKETNDFIARECIKINDQYIDELAEFILKINYNYFNVRDIFYTSKYVPNSKAYMHNENETMKYLENLDYTRVQLHNQSDAYMHVYIDKKYHKPIKHRFYIAPRPSQLHKMVYELTKEFLNEGVHVHYKFQLSYYEDNLDRIIIYADDDNREEIEKSLMKLYNKDKELFKDAERGVIWLYDSKVPNVYITPETPDSAWSSEMSKVLISAKAITRFYSGVATERNFHKLSKKDQEDTYELTKMLIPSLMLGRQLLYTKNLKALGTHTKHYFEYSNNELQQYIKDDDEEYVVKYKRTYDGVSGLLSNFYRHYGFENNKDVNVFRVVNDKHIPVVEDTNSTGENNNGGGFRK